MDSTQSQPIEIPVVVADPSQSIPSSQKQKQTSDAWSHFKKIETEKDGKKEVKAECNYCKKLLSLERTDDDWDIATLWREHLVQFYESTEIISGSDYPTIPLVLKEITKIKDICLTLESENNDLSKQLNVCDMKSKFAKYFGDLPLIYGLGVILDPRNKTKILEVLCEILYEGNANTIVEKVLTTLKELYEEYKLYLSLHDSRSQHEQAASTSSASCTSTFSRKRSRVDDLCDSKRLNTSNFSSSELSRYLDSHTEMDDDENNPLNILAWWKSQQKNYPVLSTIARDILTIPVSSVASESAFSKGGRVISDHRASLAPNSVEACICGSDWIKQEKKKVKKKMIVQDEQEWPEWFVQDAE
ncbi:hypothetical protein CerSpe_031040 [Prunus speciosa]